MEQIRRMKLIGIKLNNINLDNKEIAKFISKED